MASTGTVKWFNPNKGFGFITPEEGGNDVFVHISAVEGAGLSSLYEGQKIEYELQDNRGRTSATNLKLVEEGEESSEEVAEENVEEVAEENVEEAAEESDEEVAEESDEEVAEESDEEVAEESDEEVAEESDEEVAEESDEKSEG